MSSDRRTTSATVVGAGVAGLLAARALADHVDDVVVLERERLADAAQPRGHVPQGRHLHLLLSAGLDLLVGWFPGIDDELESAGRGPGRRHPRLRAPVRRVPGPGRLGATCPQHDPATARAGGPSPGLPLGNVALRDGVLVEGVEVG